MARSPYNVIYSATASMWDYFTLDLYIYHGGITASLPSTPTDSLTSYKVRNTDTTAYAQIEDYIQGYLDPQLTNDDYINGVSASYAEACWVKTVVRSYKLVDNVGVLYQTQTQTKPATLGYGYFTDGANPSMGNTNSIVSQSNRYGVDGYTHYDVEVNTTTNLSSELIKRTVSNDFIKMCAGDYGLMQIIFLNKYGVLDSFDFSRKNTRTMQIQSSTYDNYRPNPYSYNTREATKNIYNINATEQYVLNTDLLDESQNQIIQDLVLSDRWWLYDAKKDNIVPVILSDKAFEEKTSLNHRAKIQWSLKFDLASPKINDIR